MMDIVSSSRDRLSVTQVIVVCCYGTISSHLFIQYVLTEYLLFDRNVVDGGNYEVNTNFGSYSIRKGGD